MVPALLLAASLSAGTAPDPVSTLGQFSFRPGADNPAWTSFRLELLGWEALDPDEWDAFVEGRIRRATDLLREFGDD
ncbi:MAG: hypothetical protein WB493_10670 [Anaeromyxobacteraceae bacterium]